jgi:hypothetical protein
MYRTRGYYFRRWGLGVEPYSQEHAYSDSVRVHQRIVDASRYVVGLSVEKDSIVQTVEQAQQRIVVASCIAVVGVVMPVLVVELVTLQSVAATHIVQALGECIRWDCVCGRYEIFFQQVLPSRHFVVPLDLLHVVVDSDLEEATTPTMAVVDVASWTTVGQQGWWWR